MIKLNYDEINIIIDAFNYFIKNKIIMIDKKDMTFYLWLKSKENVDSKRKKIEKNITENYRGYIG